jgi:hypothetical protein
MRVAEVAGYTWKIVDVDDSWNISAIPVGQACRLAVRDESPRSQRGAKIRTAARSLSRRRLVEACLPIWVSERKAASPGQLRVRAEWDPV